MEDLPPVTYSVRLEKKITGIAKLILHPICLSILHPSYRNYRFLVSEPDLENFAKSELLNL